MVNDEVALHLAHIRLSLYSKCLSVLHAAIRISILIPILTTEHTHSNTQAHMNQAHQKPDVYTFLEARNNHNKKYTQKYLYHKSTAIYDT